MPLPPLSFNVSLNRARLNPINNNASSQINNNHASPVETPTPPSKIINVLDAVNIFRYFPLEALKQARLTCSKFERAANIFVKNVKVRDIEKLEQAINKFGPGGKLHITFAPDFTFSEDLKGLAALLSDTRVTGLAFDECTGLTDAHLAVLQECTKLEELRVWSSYMTYKRVTGRLLAHIPATIKKLNMRSFPGLADKLLIDALQKCTNLEEFSVLRCRRLTSKFLKHVPATVKKLKVSECYNLVGIDFTGIRKNSPKLIPLIKLIPLTE